MAYQSEDAAEDVFSVWIDHGRRPIAGQYCCLIAPDVKAGVMDVRCDTHGVEVLCNTPALQAVRHAGQQRVLAAFYEAGSVEGGGLVLSVDRPCLLVAREKRNALTFAISNPENKPLTVRVTANRRLEGDGCEWLDDHGVSLVVFDLPHGERAGQSVVRRLAAP